MRHIPRLLSTTTLLIVGVLAFGLTPACGSTTETTTAEAPDTETPTTEAEAEVAEDVVVADAETPASPDAPVTPTLSGQCEGIVGSVRSEVLLPARLGEISVMAFKAGLLSEDGFPARGTELAADFRVKPDPDTAIAPEVSASETAEVVAETGSEPEAPGLRVGYHLCLDGGEYDVVAFMDANGDNRIWTAGDLHGVARITVPPEGLVNADVILTTKIAAGGAKKGGSAGDLDQAGPTGPPDPKD
jgi:hypothetical protein